MEEKKRGRKKGQKPQAVFAVDKNTFAFVGIFNSGGDAAQVLFEDRNIGTLVLRCAKGLSKYVKDYTFTTVDMDDGFTAETIKQKTEEIKLRMAAIKPVIFKTKMLKRMGDGDLNMLKALYDKYKEPEDEESL